MYPGDLDTQCIWGNREATVFRVKENIIPTNSYVENIENIDLCKNCRNIYNCFKVTRFCRSRINLLTVNKKTQP